MKKLIVACLMACVTIFCFFPAAVTADIPLNGVAQPFNGDVIVNGVEISPLAYVSGHEGNVMVPLRAVIESLGMSVEWRPEDESIVVGGDIVIWIGRTEFYMKGSFAGNFGPPPEITEGRAFVALPFFNYVLNGYHASIQDGSILINRLPYFVYRQLDNAVNATFSRDLGGESGGFDLGTGAIIVGRSETGGEIFSFLRLPFGADFMADEISRAQLRLRVTETPEVPRRVNIGFVTDKWSAQFTPLAEAAELIDIESVVPVTLTYSEGWAVLDVTEFVRGWMAGDRRNMGFAMLPHEGEPTVSFVSGNIETLEIPYLTIAGVAGERDTHHAAFGFVSKQPIRGIVDFQDAGGNCLAFALRDLNPITEDELEIDYAELNRLFEEGGHDAVLEYVAELVETYVAANAAALQISGFLRIAGFDAPIEPTEYRIAFRVGINPIPGIPLNTDDRSFDFHLWAQIDDGRWAQKFPTDYSEIIPGTAHNLDPGRHPWDSARQWSHIFWLDIYTDRIIYFAVTKDTAEFTEHRSQPHFN